MRAPSKRQLVGKQVADFQLRQRRADSGNGTTIVMHDPLIVQIQQALNALQADACDIAAAGRLGVASQAMIEAVENKLIRGLGQLRDSLNDD